MSKTIPEPEGHPLDWSHSTIDLPAKGLEVTREATPAELAACAAELDLQVLERLTVRYRIKAASGNRYRLEGELKAKATQSCVVTLDPVPAVVTEQLTAEYRSPDDLPESDETEQGVLDAVEHEPILNQQLDVGRVVFETLAAGLPAFPRSPNAALERSEASPHEGASTSPFAGLADWKPGKG